MYAEKLTHELINEEKQMFNNISRSMNPQGKDIDFDMESLEDGIIHVGQSIEINQLNKVEIGSIA